MSKKSGFTMLELILVVIIVAVLAAGAIPVMTGSMRRARVNEARAALESIRAQLRLVRNISGGYDTRSDGAAVNVGLVVGNVPGFIAGDLTGEFFLDSDYTISDISPAVFTARALGTRAMVAGITVTINEAGDITESGY